MAKSSKQRVKTYQAAYRQRDSERKKYMNADHQKAHRQRIKQDPEKEKKEREKIKERVRKYRIKKKDSAKTVNFSTIMSVQTKGKLLKKVQKSSPKDPAQRYEVLATLLNGSFNKETTLPLNSVNNPALTEVEIKVKRFYCEDDISRLSPNVRDFVSVIENGKKIKIQVRHLLLTMKEAYQLFKHDHLDIKIGLSRFCELRPVNVRSIANLPRNVCVCTYHENMRFALDSLVKVDRLLLSNIKIGKDMSQNFVCKDSLNDCFDNKCNKCKDLKFFQQFLATIEPLNFETSWYQWQKPNEKRYAVIEKVKKFGSGKELIAHIMSMRKIHNSCQYQG